MRHPEYPKVSVVISTYDRVKELDVALASVHAQTLDDFEVIVVDDCTPDKEAVHALLESWHAKFAERGIDLIAMRLGENSGYQCMPKNRGIEMARGDYIAYLDDDNTWRPDHLESCVAAIEDGFSADMVYTRLCYHATPELAEKFKLPVGDADGVPWNPRMLGLQNYIDTSSIMHSKGAYWRLVRESGYGWDETLRRFGDWNFVWRWSIVGNNAKLVDKVTVDYNWHEKCMQLSRPAVEVPICLNYTQYQSLKIDRAAELSVA